MANVVALPRITDLNDFQWSYFQKSKPVIVEGAARKMGAFSKWTDDYLIATLKDESPKIRLADGRFARMPIASFLGYLANPSAFETTSGPLYLTDYYITPSFGDPRRAELALDAVCPLPRGGRFAEWMTLYAGPQGTVTGMHQDIFSTHTWLAELRGEKTWRICAPDALLLESGNSFDAFGTDDANGMVYEGILQAGDIIYLPPDWWHQVKNTGSSTLSISGNFCTFEAAHAIFNEVKDSHSPRIRNGWLQVWTNILAKEAILA